MKRALLIKMSSLGDVVHALPAVSDAAAHGWTFDWVVEEAFQDIPALHPAVDRVVPIAWRRWRRQLAAHRDAMRTFKSALRSQTYDCVLDSQGLIKSAVVACFARGPRSGLSPTSAREPLAGVTYGTRVRVPWGQHAIDRQRQLFAAALNYNLPVTAPVGITSEHTSRHTSEHTSEHPTERKVFLLHATTWESKHWPEAFWIELVQLIHSQGYRVEVTWGDETERTRAQALVPYGAEVIARMPLTDLARCIRSSALVVTVDSGLGHLSAALGVPTLGLYGPTDAELTGVKGERARSLQGQAHCVPCLRKTCTRYRGEVQLHHGVPLQPPCFAALTPEQVWAQGQDMLCV